MVATALVAGFAVLLAQGDPLLITLIALLAAAVVGLLWQNSREAIAPTSPPGGTVQRDPKHLEAVWDRAPLGIFLLDPHDSEKVVRILDCNQTACEMHGYTR